MLKRKYEDGYSADIYYDRLRKFFPDFIKRMIALDSVIIDLYRRNAPTQDRESEGSVMYAGSDLDSRLYTLGEDDRFQIKPEFIDALKRWARDKGLNEDVLGRTENRGCPFLLAEGRDEFTNFAIEEFISQHKKVFGS